MDQQIHHTMTVAQSGGRIEVVVPNLHAGDTVEVIVRCVDSDWDGCDSADGFIRRHSGVLSRAQVESILTSERQAWEG